MSGRKNRLLIFLAIALIAQGAIFSAWATSRCVAMEDCAPRASSPCPMGPHGAPCEQMSRHCAQARPSKILCEEGCARAFSRVPALLTIAPDAPAASAAGVTVALPVDAPRAPIASGAALAPSSRGRPALYLSTHSLLI